MHTQSPPALPTPLPTHDASPTGVVAATRGPLYRAGNCVLVTIADRAVVPIWPKGSRVTTAGVAVPGANGESLIRFGDVAYLYGAPIPDLAKSPPSPATRAASSCGTTAYLVQRAESHRALEASAPQPPSTSGLLVRRGQCLLLENVEGVILPIWPPGTEVTEQTVTTPNLRGHAPLLIGGRAGVEGRYVHADDGTLQRAAGPAASCAARGMLVEKARRVYLPNNAAEHAAMSDAVLLVEPLGFDVSDPLGDGFLTTITARVVEVLKGSFGPGEIVKIRHIAGQDEAGRWQVATHDSLFEAFGHLRPRPGERLLLFFNRDFYRQQAEARGGKPIAGYISGSKYRVADGRIENSSDLPMPDTLDELRAQIRGR